MKRSQTIRPRTLFPKRTRLAAVICIAILLLLYSKKGDAQPFLDIVNLKYTNSPDIGLINQNKNDLSLQYFSFGTNLPVQFKNRKDAVIFSPFFETWSSKVNNDKRQNYYSVALPVSFNKAIPDSKWGILLTGIVRMNDSSLNKKTKVQVGGAFLVRNVRNEHLTWKLGLYINNELFGLFVIPLAGIDWNINGRNNLFGVLPGNLTFEHKISDHFYYGVNFRAVTNSYVKTNAYWRIDENQLGIYLDTYLNKNFVVNMEAGHSIFRKIRTGVKDISKFNGNVHDNFYFKISFAYRVRFTVK